MQKIIKIVFMINVLSTIMPALKVYASDTDLETSIGLFETHPFQYFEKAQQQLLVTIGVLESFVNNSRQKTRFEKSLSRLEIVRLIDWLEGYVRMLEQKKQESTEETAHSEAITSLNYKIKLLKACVPEGEKEENKYLPFKIDNITPELLTEITADIIQEAHQILEKSFNSIKGEPLTYTQILEMTKPFVTSDTEEGKLLAISQKKLLAVSQLDEKTVEFIQLTALMRQIIKSKDAGYIYLSEYTAPDYPHRFKIVKVYSAQDSFTLPFYFPENFFEYMEANEYLYGIFDGE